MNNKGFVDLGITLLIGALIVGGFGYGGRYLNNRFGSASRRATVSTGGIVVGSPVVSGTVGSVLFIDNSGDLGEDNPNFFWDDTNNRLGVGTSSPNVLLHVDQGDLNVTDGLVRLTRSSSASVQLAGQQTNDGISRWAILGTGEIQWGDGTATRDVALQRASANTLFIDDNSGGSANFGIGTSSPSGVLAVTGPSSGFSMYLEDSSGNADFVIQADGNVGIGTTTPGTTFAVNGSTLLSGALTATGTILFQSNVDATDFFEVRDNDGGNAIFVVDTVNERVGINGVPTQTFDVNSLTDAAASVRIDGDTGAELTINADVDNDGSDDSAIFFSQGGSIRFAMGNDESSTSFVITNSGGLTSGQLMILQTDGDFGIGGIPTSRLHIFSPVDGSETIRLSADVTAEVIINADADADGTNDAVIVFEEGGSAQGSFGNDESADSFVWTNVNGFSSGVLMTLNQTTGNLGVASTSSAFDFAVGDSGMNTGDTTFTNTSHSSFKENITDSVFRSDLLDAFYETKVKDFQYTEEYIEGLGLNEYKAAKKREPKTGLLADDFNPLIGKSSELTTLSGDDRDNVMWEAIRQLIVENRELRARVEALENK